MRAARLLIVFILTIGTSSIVDGRWTAGGGGQIFSETSHDEFNEAGLKKSGKDFTNLCPNGCSIDGECGSEMDCKKFKRVTWSVVGVVVFTIICCFKICSIYRSRGTEDDEYTRT